MVDTKKVQTGSKRAIFTKDNIARAVFFALAAFSVIAVIGIVFYVLYASIPAFHEIGFFKFIFGDTWLASENAFGILKMICVSLVLTLCSVALGGFLGIFTAVFMVFYCPKPLKKVFVQVINLLAGIPSLVFGYFGLLLIKPLFERMGVTSATGLLLSTLILSLMIVPTICSLVKNSLENVPMHYYEGALALGCSKNQAVFKVLLPAAKNGVIAALVLGVGRAVGETMAVQLLLGNVVNYPLGAFLSVRSLTSNIVTEWSYALPGSVHRSALIATGFILLLFILAINLVLFFVKRNNAIAGNSFFTRKIEERKQNATTFKYRRTGSAQDILWILSYICAGIVAAMLLSVIVFVFVKGLPHLTFDLLFGKSRNSNWTLGPAFVSTGLIILLSLLVALPLGIGAAIYLNEYAKKGPVVKIIRLFIDTLAGIPSIIFGLFGYVFFGEICGMGYSLANGALTMALIILPTIIRSTEQSLSEVPDSMREASYALGAGKLRTIFKVVLPQAISGMVTSVILSIGRIAGESAALIYTAGAAGLMPNGYSSSGSTFAMMMWKFMSEGLEMDKCYATAAVLMIAVIILNLLVALTERYFRRKASGDLIKGEKHGTRKKQTENS